MKECLLNELEEKKRQIEHEFITMDANGGNFLFTSHLPNFLSNILKCVLILGIEPKSTWIWICIK